MIDHLFSAALTFCLLAGGTAAVGSLMFAAPPTTATHVRVIELPRVVITGHRVAASATIAKSDSTELSTQRTE